MAALHQSHLRLADLTTRRATAFELVPDAPERQAIADALEIRGIKKLRFSGQIAPTGKTDWTLTAELGATVVQDCVVTLTPVTTRLDEPVTRTYVAELPPVEASEIEMPEDDTIEEMPVSLNLVEVMSEALALALPLYPRAKGADLGDAVFTEPGKDAMTDDDAKPFAGLASLRESLEKKGE